MNQDVVLVQRPDQRCVLGLWIVRNEAVAVADITDRLSIEYDLIDGAIPDIAQEARIRDCLGPLPRRAETLKNRQQHDGNDDPENDVLC